MNPDELVGFLEANWFALIFWSVLALVVFRLIRPIVRRLADRVIRSREAKGMDPAELNELRKRLATVEDLVAKLLRAIVILVVLVVVLTLLDLVSVILALGLLLAGIAIAGQSIVLDYLMGILILVEGQFYVGDTVTIATGNVTVSGDGRGDRSPADDPARPVGHRALGVERRGPGVLQPDPGVCRPPGRDPDRARG